MRIYHDWEFLENGETIRPIAVAMCTDDGRELYRVFREIEEDALYNEITEHPWLMANVVPHLPLRAGSPPGAFALDRLSPYVGYRDQIRTNVQDFLDGYPAGVELWGWYSSYDHVCLAQLFGRMIDLPKGLPMLTRDLKQRQDRFKKEDRELPGYGTSGHHPLAEVRLMRDWAAHMDELERSGEGYSLY